MPQMSPTWWTLIMIMTISLLTLSMSMMYFSLIYTNKLPKKKHNKPMNWKWL